MTHRMKLDIFLGEKLGFESLSEPCPQQAVSHMVYNFSKTMLYIQSKFQIIRHKDKLNPQVNSNLSSNVGHRSVE